MVENQLFRAGYQIVTVSKDELDKRLNSAPRLVLSYLRLDPEEIAARGVPVLMMVQHGGSDNERVDRTGAPVAYLPNSVGSQVLIDKIRTLTPRGEERRGEEKG